MIADGKQIHQPEYFIFFVDFIITESRHSFVKNAKAPRSNEWLSKKEFVNLPEQFHNAIVIKQINFV